jgi:hypothetical protein
MYCRVRVHEQENVTGGFPGRGISSGSGAHSLTQPHKSHLGFLDHSLNGVRSRRPVVGDKRLEVQEIGGPQVAQSVAKQIRRMGIDGEDRNDDRKARRG